MFDSAQAGGVSALPPAMRMFHYPKVDEIAASGTNFRQVLWTGENSQFVIMTIPVGGEIGEEVHDVDQHLILTSGTCRAIVEGEEKEIAAGDLVIVPAGALHNFVNNGDKPFQLYTFYAPAEHNYNTIHRTKEEGDKEEEEHLDEPPEWAVKGLIKKKQSSE